ncbi:hypothetical protein Tco_0435964, partial [Tanacetum coccineum]
RQVPRLFEETVSCMWGSLEVFSSKIKIPKRVLTTRPQVSMGSFDINAAKSSQNSRESPGQGFAAALSFLITGASQSSQHDKSESISYCLPD